MRAPSLLGIALLVLAACAAPSGEGGTGDAGGTGGDTGTVTGGGTSGGGTNADAGSGGGGTAGGTGTVTGGGADAGTGTGEGAPATAAQTVGLAGIACDAYAATLGQLTLRHEQGALDAAPMADTFVVVKAVAPRCENPNPPGAGGDSLVRLQIAANGLIGLVEGRPMSVLEMSATDSPFLLAENDQSLAADIEPLPMPAQVSAGLRQTLFNVAVAGSPHWAAYQSAATTPTLPKAMQDWAGVNQRAKAARLAWEQSAG